MPEGAKLEPEIIKLAESLKEDSQWRCILCVRIKGKPYVTGVNGLDISNEEEVKRKTLVLVKVAFRTNLSIENPDWIREKEAMIENFVDANEKRWEKEV